MSYFDWGIIFVFQVIYITASKSYNGLYYIYKNNIVFPTMVVIFSIIFNVVFATHFQHGYYCINIS